MVDTLTITEQPAPIETVAPLKPSEALRLGRAMGMQYTSGAVETGGQYCAVGVIGQVMSGVPANGYSILGMRRVWANLYMIPCRCPGVMNYAGYARSLFGQEIYRPGWDTVANIVVHLNDTHHPESWAVIGGKTDEIWDDGRIAGFLESIGR